MTESGGEGTVDGLEAWQYLDTLDKISFHPATASFLQDGSLRLFLFTTLLLDSKLGAGEISKQSANNLISGSLKSSFAWSTDIKKQGSTPKVFAEWTQLDLHADSSSLSGICVAMARNRA